MFPLRLRIGEVRKTIRIAADLAARSDGPTVLTLGGCHGTGATRELERRGAVHAAIAGDLPCNSVPEIRQFLLFSQRRLPLSSVAGIYCAVDRPTRWLRALQFSRASVVFLDVGTSVHIECGSLVLSWTRIRQRVVFPVSALGRTERSVAHRWLMQGLMKQDEPVREAASRELREIMQRHEAFTAQDMGIVRDARGIRQTAIEIAAGVDAILGLLGRPTTAALLTAPSIYLPDGRPIFLPADFATEMDAVSRRIGAPILHTSDVVGRLGGPAALMPDLVHYTPVCLRALADDMLALAGVKPPDR